MLNPPSSALLPKVKRLAASMGAMPTVANMKPIRAEKMPFFMFPLPIVATIDSEKIAMAKYS